MGVDRGLSAFLVAAQVDGTEVARITNAPKALAAGMKRQRRLAKSLSRKQKGSRNRRDAAARLGRSGMLHNHRLAQAISDAGWTEFARILAYKQGWRHGTVLLADRWYPSSKRCSHCGTIRADLTLADRVFRCTCGYVADRDLNAAVNLAAWGQQHHDDPPLDPRTPKQRGRATNARRRGRH